jgi:hypothetical protein
MCSLMDVVSTGSIESNMADPTTQVLIGSNGVVFTFKGWRVSSR